MGPAWLEAIHRAQTQLVIVDCARALVDPQMVLLPADHTLHEGLGATIEKTFLEEVEGVASLTR